MSRGGEALRICFSVYRIRYYIMNFAGRKRGYRKLGNIMHIGCPTGGRTPKCVIRSAGDRRAGGEGRQVLSRRRRSTQRQSCGIHSERRTRS